MFKRAHIEKFLKLNGVEIDSSDEEIKSVLISAQWHKDDVEAAILVLKENVNNHETHVDSLHKVFRTDQRLRPETISSLLGIEMNLTSKDIEAQRKYSSGSMTPSQIMQIAFVSLTLSVIFVVSAMWYLQMGIFHSII